MFDSYDVQVICNYKNTKGYFLKKDDLKKILLNASYDNIKNHVFISLPSRLLSIHDDKEFLQNLTSYNSAEVNIKIKETIRFIQNNKPKKFGYMYVLKDSGDSHTRWNKVGKTIREPEIRANEWKYNLKHFRLCSSSDTFERFYILVEHMFLNNIRLCVKNSM